MHAVLLSIILALATAMMNDPELRSYFLWGLYKPAQFFAVTQMSPCPLTIGLALLRKSDLTLIHLARHGNADYSYHDGMRFAESSFTTWLLELNATMTFLKLSADRKKQRWVTRVHISGRLPDYRVLIYVMNENLGSTPPTLSSGKATSIYQDHVGPEKLTYRLEQDGESAWTTIHSPSALATSRSSRLLVGDPAANWNLNRAYFDQNRIFSANTSGSIAFTEYNVDAHEVTLWIEYSKTSSQRSFPKLKFFEEVRKAKERIDKKIVSRYMHRMVKWRRNNWMLEFMRSQIANILGGIAYFYGHNPDQYRSRHKIARNQELLISTVCRRFSTIGSLYSEGFTQLVIVRWNYNLTILMLDSLFNFIDLDGYLPSQFIIGPEAESLNHDGGFGSSSPNSNEGIPPTIIMPMLTMSFHIYKRSKIATFFKENLDKIELWFTWFRSNTEMNLNPESDYQNYAWPCDSVTKCPWNYAWQRIEEDPDDHIYWASDAREPGSRVILDSLDLNCWIVEVARVLHEVRDSIALPTDEIDELAQGQLEHLAGSMLDRNDMIFKSVAMQKFFREERFIITLGFENLAPISHGIAATVATLFPRTMSFLETDLLTEHGITAISNKTRARLASFKETFVNTESLYNIWSVSQFFVLRGLRLYYRDYNPVGKLFKNLSRRFRQTVSNGWNLSREVWEAYDVNGGLGIRNPQLCFVRSIAVLIMNKDFA